MIPDAEARFIELWNAAGPTRSRKPWPGKMAHPHQCRKSTLVQTTALPPYPKGKAVRWNLWILDAIKDLQEGRCDRTSFALVRAAGQTEAAIRPPTRPRGISDNV
jgi:hypothetical protein